MDNNKRKPKLVAEHPAACRRRQDGAAATCDDVVAASRWGVDCGCPRRWWWAGSRHEGQGTLGMWLLTDAITTDYASQVAVIGYVWSWVWLSSRFTTERDAKLGMV